MSMSKTRIVRAAIAVTAILSAPAWVHAVTYDTWTDGSGTNNNFATAGNWLSGIAPNTSTNTQLFNSSPTNSLTVNISLANTNILNTQFNSSAGSFNFTGSSILFNSNGSVLFNIDGSVSNATITVANTIQAWSASSTTNANRNITFTNASATSSLVLNGNISGGATTGIDVGVVFNAGTNGASAVSAPITVNGNISDGTVGGNVVVAKGNGAQGILTLNGTNIYTGGTELSGNTSGLVLGNTSALGTGALRLLETTTGTYLQAGIPLTGASAIPNTFNFVSNNFVTTTTSNAVISFTSGLNTGTLTSGTAPAVGDYVTAGNSTELPRFERVTARSGTAAGSTITFDNNAVATGSTTLTTKPYNTSGTAALTIAGSNNVEFSGTLNLSTVWSNNGATTQTFNITNTGTTTFSGVMQQQDGVAGIIKTGTGPLFLTNTNTYTGTTNISAGSLYVNGQNASSITTANSSATLGGSGTITNTVNVSSGGIVAPGADATHIAALNTGNENWTSGSILTTKIATDNATAAAGTSNDELVVSGLLSLPSSGTMTLNIKSLVSGVSGNAFDGTQAFTWVIATASGGITHFTSSLFSLNTTGFTGTNYVPSSNNTSSSGTFAVSVDGTGDNLDLTYTDTVAPEPTSFLLLGLAAMPMVLRRRPRLIEEMTKPESPNQ